MHRQSPLYQPLRHAVADFGENQTRVDAALGRSGLRQNVPLALDTFQGRFAGDNITVLKAPPGLKPIL
jgi:hypothetical protein